MTVQNEEFNTEYKRILNNLDLNMILNLIASESKSDKSSKESKEKV